MQSMTRKRQKTGDRSNGSNSAEQRSFRERRTQRMRELEEQVLCLSMAQDERNALLVSENRALRDMVTQTKHQASRIGLLLKELNDSLAGWSAAAHKGSPVPHPNFEGQSGGDSGTTRPELTLDSSDLGVPHGSASLDFFPEATQFAPAADADVLGRTADPFDGDASSFTADVCFHAATPDPGMLTALLVRLFNSSPDRTLMEEDLAAD
ncbi:hypothetical protein LCI18_013900 [Fusarium solani-melongenae]|uniref:Uncharacterized protein n=1 Tax=Fusarium solani subsp. cucurbitae TaxID=2747967 RepID=A0ACD3ZP09_FUSSC|nr:hypothetical protein LCI18_013900 [Fusarium solani-melongenae]